MFLKDKKIQDLENDITMMKAREYDNVDAIRKHSETEVKTL